MSYFYGLWCTYAVSLRRHLQVLFDHLRDLALAKSLISLPKSTCLTVSHPMLITAKLLSLSWHNTNFLTTR